MTYLEEIQEMMLNEAPREVLLARLESMIHDEKIREEARIKHAEGLEAFKLEIRQRIQSMK